jgi:hypothetical protein
MIRGHPAQNRMLRVPAQGAFLENPNDFNDAQGAQGALGGKNTL